jgi:hypothetical protein
MTAGIRRRALIVALGCTSLPASFLAGWYVSRHIFLVPTPTAESINVAARGDASQDVREQVLQAMHAFQDGYTKRDVNNLEAFMRRHFMPRDHNLVLGTDGGEWARGHQEIAAFIRGDWAGWGDVRLDVNASTISAAGDVAWLVTTGDVYFQGSIRPIRFSATLVRADHGWVFRHIQFQWEETRRPTFRELLDPGTLMRIRMG